MTSLGLVAIRNDLSEPIPPASPQQDRAAESRCPRAELVRLGNDHPGEEVQEQCASKGHEQAGQVGQAHDRNIPALLAGDAREDTAEHAVGVANEWDVGWVVVGVSMTPS